jgi:hypothetical protein
MNFQIRNKEFAGGLCLGLLIGFLLPFGICGNYVLYTTTEKGVAMRINTKTGQAWIAYPIHKPDDQPGAEWRAIDEP